MRARARGSVDKSFLHQNLQHATRSPNLRHPWLRPAHARPQMARDGHLTASEAPESCKV